MTARDPEEQQTNAAPKTEHSLLKILPYLVLFVSAWAVFGETTDDPFITFRYAANFASGYGAVYNAGERVEGFTSWLHLLACSVLYILLPSVGLLLKAKLLSLICGGVVLYQTGRLAAKLSLTPSMTLAAQLLLAFNLNFAIASVNALETTLFTAVLLSAVSRFVVEMEREDGILSGLLLFLACFTRPEALIYVVFLIGFRLYLWRQKQLSRRFVVGWLLWFAVPMALFLAFRLAYYGYPFPNTYYAKSVTLTYGITNGLPYLRQPFLPHSGLFVRYPIIMAGIIGYWALALFGMISSRREAKIQLLTLLVLGSLIFILRVGGDWMSGCRFLIPVLPFVTLLQVRGIVSLAQKRAEPSRPKIQFALVALTLFVISGGYFGFPLGLWTKRGSPLRDDRLLASCAHPYGQTWITIGQFFREALPPGASIAYSEVGYAAYLNRDKHFLDTFGLTDKEIAHVEGVERCRFGVVTMFWNPPSDPVQQILRRRKPDYVIIGSVAMPNPMPQRLMQDYEPMPLPPKWKTRLVATQFGFYRRLEELPL